MSTQTFKITLLALLFGTYAPLKAQTKKPRVYIDPQGLRYTQQQFDSISIANMGKPISKIDMSEKEEVVEITFEIMDADPNVAYIEKWVGHPFPAFSLKDPEGKLYDNASILGNPVVVNFWSTSCVPCLKEMPELSAIEKQYTKEGVIFLAPAPEDKAKISKTLTGREFTYKLLPDAQALFRALSIESFPIHMFVDKKGIIQQIFFGTRINTKTNEVELGERFTNTIEEILNK